LLRQDALAAVDKEIYQQALEAIKEEAQKVLEEQVKRSKRLEGVSKKPTLG
jgi:uncharacterized lipoprotein YehR (DUF1307 family)